MPCQAVWVKQINLREVSHNSCPSELIRIIISDGQAV